MILPKKTILGELKYFEIYDYIDGARCFSTINQFKQRHLVYWSGDLANGDHTWLYTFISEKRLDDLRRKTDSILTAFEKPEQHVYYVTTPRDGKKSKCEQISPKEINDYNLPPDSFYIEPDEIIVVSEEANWNFALKIAKKSVNTQTPTREMVTNVIDACSEIIEELMVAFSDSNRDIPKLYPVNAAYGSFEVKMGSKDNNKTSEAIKRLAEILKNTDEIDSKLRFFRLDPYRLRELLDIINQDKLKIVLSPKTYDYIDESITIGETELTDLLVKLEESTNILIDSSKIPQANDIDKVIEIVQIVSDGRTLSHELIEGLNSPRQVSYYTDAAFCLGLLNKNRTLTSAGRFLCSKTDNESKYQFLADRFESSDFGWKWMKWSKVNSLSDLDGDTAAQFISESVINLSEDTARRRAQTLKKWLDILKNYRREYHTEKK